MPTPTSLSRGLCPAKANISIGMSLYTLADLLVELGAGEATMMVVINKIVNKLSDQSGERSVSDAILNFPKPNERNVCGRP